MEVELDHTAVTGQGFQRFEFVSYESRSLADGEYQWSVVVVVPTRKMLMLPGEVDTWPKRVGRIRSERAFCLTLVMFTR